MTNVALVVLDTLRKDAFDDHFEWLPGVKFDRAWSTSHATVPSHASLFTGLYASETGVYGTGEMFDFPGDSLAELLRDAGIKSRGFSCNPFISDTFGFTRGFESMKRNWSSRRLDDDVFDWGSFESDRRFGGPLRFPEAIYRVLRSDTRTLLSLKHGVKRKLYFDNSRFIAGDKGAREVLEHLRGTTFADDNFFYVNLMEAHGPYKCPKEYQTVTETNQGSSFADVLGFETERAANTRQAYQDCVRYLSDIYQDIFEELRADFDYVITIADHGELLGEDDNWGHNFGVHPKVTNVPFSIWAADGSHDTLDTEATVGHTDVFATILGRFGVENPSERRGIDLFDGSPSTPRLTEYHGISQPDKIERIRALDHDKDLVGLYDSWLRGLAPQGEPYAYETVHDGEFEFRTTGGGGDGAEKESVQEHLEQEHEALDVRSAESTVQYSDSVREELEHLGYL